MKIKNVLFMCVANLNRSPISHIILNNINQRENLGLNVDSCGILDKYAGESPRKPLIDALSNMGYYNNFQIKSKPFNMELYSKSDIVLYCDPYCNLALNRDGKLNKFVPLWKYSIDKKLTNIPDPHRGDYSKFVESSKIIEDCIKNFVRELKNEK